MATPAVCHAASYGYAACAASTALTALAKALVRFGGTDAKPTALSSEAPCCLPTPPASPPTSPKERARQTEARTFLAAPKMDAVSTRALLAASRPSSGRDENEETAAIAGGSVATAGTCEIGDGAEPPAKADKGRIAIQTA